MKKTETINVQSEADLPAAVEGVLRFANGRKKFALTGGLGAGKTTFTQFFCKKIGVKTRATSPTFALVNEHTYLDETGAERLFHHLDLYRLKDLQEALDIGIEDYLYDDEYCFIEWPDLIDPLLPEDTVRLKLTVLPDSSRKILLL